MANEIKEIGDIVKQCKILLLDIEGTTTSISFVKDKLFPYAEENVQKFLESEWETQQVKEAVASLRKLALEDQENKVEGVVAIPAEDAPRDEQIAGLVSSVKWQMSSDRKVSALKQLQGLVWKQGYDNGDIKGHVYDDVAAALEQWRSTEGQKVYIYSSGSVEAQKLLFGQSLAGDLLARIDGHFDTAVGGKQEPASYAAIAAEIGAKPEEILFLTDVVKEAEAASAAGLQAALVSRAGNAPLPARPAFPVLHSLAQLASNKRRPTQVEEETPAKVLKTDVEKDVKAEAVTVAATEGPKEQEKMEVESEGVAPVEQSTEAEKETKVVTVIEEITDSNEPVDAPVIEMEPVVEEEIKSESQKETKTTNGNADSEPKQDVEMETKVDPVAEKVSPPDMEIEEIPSDKADIDDVVDNLTPVVEEPPSEDMEVLQNVGEVLDKECDDILSKVQDVTNLDSITVKPLLNPIAEEAENLDSNDIVDRILDTEELEMKQKEILDAAAGENKKAKQNSVTNETRVKEANGIDKATPELNVESKKNVEESSPKEVSTEVKSEGSSVMETKVEDKKEAVTEPKDTPVENVLSEEKSKESTVENKPVEDSKSVSKSLTEEVKTVDESSSAANVKVAEESKANETNNIEQQMNGKATNGDSAPNMNGDGKEEELCSRLGVENGKAQVNGQAQDQGAGDVKVKTVAAAEPVAAPIDNTTEA